MQRGINILITVLIGVVIFMVTLHEMDINDNKLRRSDIEGWVVNHDSRIANLEGGLASADGGLTLSDIRDRSVRLTWTAKRQVVSVFGVVSEQTYSGHGTGAFVSSNAVLTAAHVVDDADPCDYIIRLSSGIEMVAKEFIVDANDDLALVIVDGTSDKWFDLGPKPKLGDKLVCVGSPLTNWNYFNISLATVSSEMPEKQFMYDGFCYPGCSGGPIIHGGKLVGVVQQHIQRGDGLGFAGDVTRLDKELLDRF